MAETFTLNGRRFVHIGESTIGHDVWLIGQIKNSGLDTVLVTAGEDPTRFASRMLLEVCARGVIFNLLGGLIVPEGQSGFDWSERSAHETAEHLKSVRDPTEKAIVHGLIIEALVDFFGVGLSSFLISQTSSNAAEPENEIAVSHSTGTGED